MIDTEVRPLPIVDDTIRAAVERELGKVDPGSRVAWIAHVDGDSARTALLVRISDRWSFGGYLDKHYYGPLDGGAELRFQV